MAKQCSSWARGLSERVEGPRDWSGGNPRLDYVGLKRTASPHSDSIDFHDDAAYFSPQLEELMSDFSREEIRLRFSSATNFNEIFDAFESAINQHIDDIELYRQLFWNDSLRIDEIILFGEKLAKEFPHNAYDVYMWMANVFEAVFSSEDNFEHSLMYYQKAAAVNPAVPDPYLDACDCYDPDLNIPPLESLIDFVKKGLDSASEKKNLSSRLSYLYHLLGDEDLAEYYRLMAEEAGELPPS